MKKLRLACALILSTAASAAALAETPDLSASGGLP
jgi:hypothetical protein